MKSRRFSTREKTLLLILALLLVGVAYYLLVQVPIAEQRGELAAQMTETESEMMVEQVKNDRLEGMRGEIGALAGQPDSPIKPVPAYDNVQSVMLFLSQTFSPAQKYSVSFDPVDASEQFVRRVVRLTFDSADYAAAKATVQLLLNGPYRCQAGDFTLSATEKGVAVTLTLTFFEAQSSIPAEEIPAVPAE